MVSIPPTMINTPASLNIRRQGRGLAANPRHRLQFPGFEGQVDQDFDAEYFGPHLIRTGGATRVSSQDGEGAALGTNNFIHAITPETPTSTHYFVMTTRNYRIDDENLAAMNLAAGANIQPEDIAVIEAIENSVDELADPRRELSCAADVGAMRARRRLATQITAELEAG